MNKAEMIDVMAEAADISKAAAARALDAYTGAIASELSNGGSVAIAGHGTYSVSERSARTGRNPQTGETIQIAASKAAKFKAGKKLKDEVNK